MAGARARTRPLIYCFGVAEQREKSPTVKRLLRRKEQHRQHGKIYRAAFVVAGFIVLGAGLAMLLLPGPAFVVIPVGLAILALEFAWAEHLLENALEKADAAKQKAAEASRTQKILSAIAAALGVAAAVAAAIVWDIPLLPV